MRLQHSIACCADKTKRSPRPAAQQGGELALSGMVIAGFVQKDRLIDRGKRYFLTYESAFIIFPLKALSDT